MSEINTSNNNEQTSIGTIKSIGRLKGILKGEENTTIDKIRQYESYVGKIVKIPITEIQLDENIRRKIDIECSNFKSLLSSIIKHGIQQNIVVEFRNYGDSYSIVCVSGHRRVTAAKMTGTINVVPALIKKFEKDDARTEHALIENLLREDLHFLDIADGYRDLFSKGWSRE
jgi:ParB/RepB/Spo0J family partition protein